MPTGTVASAPAVDNLSSAAVRNGTPGAVAATPSVSPIVSNVTICYARAGASVTAARNVRTRVRNSPRSPPSGAEPRSDPPMPKASAPARRKAGTSARVTPPVGISGPSGSGPLRSSRT